MCKRGRDVVANIKHLEFFAGKQAIVNAFLNRGHIAVPYEKLHDSEKFDLTGAMRFATAVALSMKVEIGGSCNAAPVCSSWTFMNLALRHL